MNSKTSVRAAMYQEAPAAKEQHSRKYLVLYQTDHQECLKSQEYLNDVRHSSEMWPGKKATADVGDFDGRNYELIQDYDPDGKGEGERAGVGNDHFCLLVGKVFVVDPA